MRSYQTHAIILGDVHVRFKNLGILETNSAKYMRNSWWVIFIEYHFYLKDVYFNKIANFLNFVVYLNSFAQCLDRNSTWGFSVEFFIYKEIFEIVFIL